MRYERIKNPDYIHHQNIDASIIKEFIFGAEDGMVSTMGSITGIAAATGNPFTVILAGSVIIAVESISMAVGSYLSNKSEQSIDRRMIEEEKEEIKNQLMEEKEEMIELFVRDGWPKKLAKEMADITEKDKDLMLREMAYRELKIDPDDGRVPFKNGIVMGFSYIAGGLIPLLPYLFLDLFVAIPVSIVFTLVSLFVLGSFTSRYSRRTWWKAGAEMLVLAGLAAMVGYLAGQAIDNWWASGK